MRMQERTNETITIEDHLRIAKNLITAKHAMSLVYKDLLKFFTVNEAEKFLQLVPHSRKSKFTQLTSNLDDNWHSLISDELHAQYGRVYYAETPEEVGKRK